MGNFRKWSSTASGNASIAGGATTINFAEGQAPSTVNNSVRETLAQLRSLYDVDEWAWIEHSSTASVATQTTVKLATNLTADYTAGRRIRLSGGSTTRYGTVVSSSFTSETTITVTVDSGSLSASHTIAALSAIVSNTLPTSLVTSASLATALAPYMTSLSSSAAIVAALSTYVTSASVATALGPYITSASVSTALTAQVVRVKLGTITGNGINSKFSGTWTDYPSFELRGVATWEDPGATANNMNVGVNLYTDGGTTPFFTFNTPVNSRFNTSLSGNAAFAIEIFGNGSTAAHVLGARGNFTTALEGTIDESATASTGAFAINAIGFFMYHSTAGTVSYSAAAVYLYGLK